MQDRRERRRRDRNSLRGIWQGIWRNPYHPEQDASPGSAGRLTGSVLRHSSLEATGARLRGHSQGSEAPTSRLQSPFATVEPPLQDYQVRLEGAQPVSSSLSF